MKPHGTYKISHRRQTSRDEYSRPLTPREIDHDAILDPILGGGQKLQRILESLRQEIITSAEGRNVRIRQIFREPREIYRLELTLPELGYQRTTLLDADALEELLEADDVRRIIRASIMHTDPETAAARSVDDLSSSTAERCPGQDSNLHGR